MPRATRVATLWELSLDGNRVSCGVYRLASGLQLRVTSPTAIILTERFDLGPRALARAGALRDGLERRGWREQGRRRPDG
jgi:hypothetical protein